MTSVGNSHEKQNAASGQIIERLNRGSCKAKVQVCLSDVLKLLYDPALDDYQLAQVN